jgi:hypothetical protein
MHLSQNPKFVGIVHKLQQHTLNTLSKIVSVTEDAVLYHLSQKWQAVICSSSVYYSHMYCKWWTLGAPGRATGI